MSNYYTILTTAGKTKVAAALANNTTVEITEFALGDGNGADITPTESMNSLVRERHRRAVNTLYVHPSNANWIVAEVVVPQDVGGWTVREVGLYDITGTLIAVGSYPATYKPLLESGVGKELCLRAVMSVSNVSSIKLSIDPSIVTATRGYVDQAMAIPLEHIARTDNPHGVTAAQVGAAEAEHTHTPASLGAADEDHFHLTEEIIDLISGSHLWLAPQRMAATVLPYAASLAWPMVSAQAASVTLTGDTVLANPASLPSGRTQYSLLVRQDAVGGHTLSYGSTFLPTATGGTLPEIATEANSYTLLVMESDGINIYVGGGV